MSYRFRFVIGNSIAASGAPGFGSSLQKDLLRLKKNHIQAIVSLTELSLPPAMLEELEFEYLHLPIKEFSPPSLAQIDEFVNFVRTSLRQKKKLLVHCRAGYGRTGTLLACYLVARGYSAARAIRYVRSQIPGAIETTSQEDAIFHYEVTLNRK